MRRTAAAFALNVSSICVLVDIIFAHTRRRELDICDDASGYGCEPASGYIYMCNNIQIYVNFLFFPFL